MENLPVSVLGKSWLARRLARNDEEERQVITVEDMMVVEQAAQEFSEGTFGAAVEKLLDLLNAFKSEYIDKTEVVFRDTLCPMLEQALESDIHDAQLAALKIVTAVYTATSGFVDSRPSFKSLIIRKGIQVILDGGDKEGLLPIACDLLMKLLGMEGILRIDLWRSRTMVRIIERIESETSAKALESYYVLLFLFSQEKYVIIPQDMNDRKEMLTRLLRGIGVLYSAGLYAEFIGCLAGFFPDPSELFRVNMILETDYLLKANSKLKTSLEEWADECNRDEQHQKLIHHGLFLISRMFVGINQRVSSEFFQMIPWKCLVGALCDARFQEFLPHMLSCFSVIIDLDGEGMIHNLLEVGVYRVFADHFDEFPFNCKRHAVFFLMKSLERSNMDQARFFLMEYNILTFIFENIDINDEHHGEALLKMINDMLRNPMFVTACRQNMELIEQLEEARDDEEDTISVALYLLLRQLEKGDTRFDDIQFSTPGLCGCHESDDAGSPGASGDEC